MKKIIAINVILLLILSSCVGNVKDNTKDSVFILENQQKRIEVHPATFALYFIEADAVKYLISAPAAASPVEKIEHEATKMSWRFSGSGIGVSLQLKGDYLDVSITADRPSEFTWPSVKGECKAYTIPLHQGKYIPATDPKWIEHMTERGAISGTQDLSMQFFGVNIKEKAVVYIIKSMYNNELTFWNNGGTLALNFAHEFPSTVKDKQYGFRIYLTAGDPVAIAKTYQQFIKETSGIVTLAEKQQSNPNIALLYGAPHIYMWNTDCVATTDILQWKKFKDDFLNGTSLPARRFLELFSKKEAESGKELLKEIKTFRNETFVSKYFKSLLVNALNEALSRRDLYNEASWKNISLQPATAALIKKGVAQLNATELYRLNELLLHDAFAGIMRPVEDWGGTPLALLSEMQDMGIKKAWLGLNDWEAGEKHPAFVAKANEMGYLIGPYDSYHSMHPPGKARWLTADFKDTTLYTRAFVTNKNGKPYGGFLGEGRKLNPVLSMPAVEQRVNEVMKNSEGKFNSWFIDCDATGEIFDDYSAGRETSQKEDIEARLKRMAWIRDKFQLVIGSEVGNDFAAGTIAYGHGMTTPVIAWNDPDLRKNKSSPYFLGSYFSNTGGIPAKYVKPTPMKEKYLYCYFDNRFNVPLFQLVYNNSVVTSHHWEMGSLKVPGEVKNTEIKEILYNTPPMYHLDEENWNTYKTSIAPHVKVFTKTHAIAVREEMNTFEWLTPDHLVQRTVFGNKLEVIANFGAQPFKFKEKMLPSKAVFIHDLSSNQIEIYQP